MNGKTVSFLLLICAFATYADKIAFITFRIRDDNVRIVSTVLTEGKLKPNHYLPEDDYIISSLLSNSNDTIYKIAVPDPLSVKRLEYGDPSGKIESIEVPSNDSIFVVRFPYSAGTAHIALSRHTRVRVISGLSKSVSVNRQLGVFKLDTVFTGQEKKR